MHSFDDVVTELRDDDELDDWMTLTELGQLYGISCGLLHYWLEPFLDDIAMRPIRDGDDSQLRATHVEAALRHLGVMDDAQMATPIEDERHPFRRA